jgi:O-antigen biosynthesis protein
MVKHFLSPLEKQKQAGYYRHPRLDVLRHLSSFGGRPVKVLELGCAAGETARELRTLCNVEFYTGLEVSELAAAKAREVINKVIVTDINSLDLEHTDLGSAHFDLILALDVLEHLIDPWSVLASLRTCLAPEGKLVLSLPNVSNIWILNGLSEGCWTYEDDGLLDATHLRFFTLDSIKELVQGAAFEITAIEPIYNLAFDDRNLSDDGNTLKIGKLIIQDLSRDALKNLCVFQYIVFAQLLPS